VSYTALPTKNPGDLLTSALWNTYLQGNADSGFLRMLADTTLIATAASVTFASIPATFAHLLGVFYARTTSATTTDDFVNAQFNGDTAANYDRETLTASTAAVSASETFGITSASIGTAVGGGGAASVFSAFAFLIPHYAGTAANKAFLGLGTAKWATVSGGLAIRHFGGFWRSNAAINQIVLLPAAGSFAIGSRFTLYGLPQ
jgi:hypothetical protein